MVGTPVYRVAMGATNAVYHAGMAWPWERRPPVWGERRYRVAMGATNAVRQRRSPHINKHSVQFGRPEGG